MGPAQGEGPLQGNPPPAVPSAAPAVAAWLPTSAVLTSDSSASAVVDGGSLPSCSSQPSDHTTGKEDQDSVL